MKTGCNHYDTPRYDTQSGEPTTPLVAPEAGTLATLFGIDAGLIGRRTWPEGDRPDEPRFIARILDKIS